MMLRQRRIGVYENWDDVNFKRRWATDPASVETQELVGTIAGMNIGSGFHIHVAGEAASNLDFFSGLGDRLPWVIVWVALASFVVLLFDDASLLRLLIVGSSIQLTKSNKRGPRTRSPSRSISRA